VIDPALLPAISKRRAAFLTVVSGTTTTIALVGAIITGDPKFVIVGAIVLLKMLQYGAIALDRPPMPRRMVVVQAVIIAATIAVLGLTNSHWAWRVFLISGAAISLVFAWRGYNSPLNRGSPASE
jgi:hypothetical protein